MPRPKLAAGHFLGDHGWSHPSFSGVSLDRCEETTPWFEELLRRIVAKEIRFALPATGGGPRD